ncbi:scabin-related ADP-ribosyltransferase [Actinoallomurus acaciae]|uniref:Pierisin-like domain-containing protein n=1 Tax=Actinoallomurus acaciae TaxID=502577 RepID=A0ABV5YLZ8_9ACTN
MGTITPPPIWYGGVGSLYRADTREPETIFIDGFQPRSPDNLDLYEFVQFGADENAAFGFVSTSESLEWARDWRSTGYVYELDSGRGVDVVETMAAHSIALEFAEQTEVAFPGGVATEFIKGAWELIAATTPGESNALGRWIPNPNYRVGPHGGADTADAGGRSRLAPLSKDEPTDVSPEPTGMAESPVIAVTQETVPVERPAGTTRESHAPAAYLDTPRPDSAELPATGSTQSSQGDDARTLLRQGGAGREIDGIIDSWETLSRLPRYRLLSQWRSAALKEVDRALRQWKDGGRRTPDRSDQNKRELRNILDAIDRWWASKEDRGSNRSAAISHLQEAIRSKLDEVVDERHKVSSIEPMLATDYASASNGDSMVGASQRMVPAGRDLAVAKYLLDQATIDPFGEKLADTERAIEVVGQQDSGRNGAVIRELRQRRRNILEDQLIFNAMRARTDWSQLEPVQAAALVLAERRGRAIEGAERRALIERLRDEDWEWATKYPLDDEHIDQLIDQVHDFMQHRMILTVNVPLSKLNLLTANVENLLKTGWETDQTSTYLNTRGNVEEWLGYGASVKRNLESGGIYPPNPVTSGSKQHFSPNEQDRKQLPKYAALISPLRQAGLGRYGEVAFHLTPELRGRATFTPYDSFAPDLKGSRGVTSRSNLIPLLVHGSGNMVRAVFAEATEFAYDFSETLARSIGATYFEAQIHGNVSWKNVDKIVLSHYFATTNTTAKNMLEEFAANNGFAFTVEINKRENVFQPKEAKAHGFEIGSEETNVDLAPELRNWQLWSSALGVDGVSSAGVQQRPDEPRMPRPESPLSPNHSSQYGGTSVAPGPSSTNRGPDVTRVSGPEDVDAVIQEFDKEDNQAADWIAGLETTGEVGMRGGINAPTEHDTGRPGSTGSTPGRVRPGAPPEYHRSQHAGERGSGATSGRMAGSLLDALAEIDWEESSYSDGKACVSVAVVGLSPVAGR